MGSPIIQPRINNRDEQFADLFPDYTPHRGASLPEHARRTQEMRQEEESMLAGTGWAGCTVLNLNPFVLRTNGGALIPDVIPPCPFDKPWTKYRIEQVRWAVKDMGSDDQGRDNFVPKPILPVHIGYEFYREAYELNKIGGVVVYLDSEDHDPNYFRGKEVQVPLQQLSAVEGRRHVKTGWSDFDALLEYATRLRNNEARHKVEEADGYFRDMKNKQIVDTHRSAYDLLQHLGILDQPRPWRLQAHDDSKTRDRLECPQCSKVIQSSASGMCPNCANVLDPLTAYLASKIEYGNVAMDLMTTDEWVIAMTEKERREANKKNAQLAVARAKKAAGTEESA